MSGKIAVIGIGGVGGYIGSLLANYYDNVTFVARGDRARKLDKEGLTLYSDNNGIYNVKPRVVDDVAKLEPQDFIFICVKNYSLDNVCKQLLKSNCNAIKEGTVIIPIMNGVDPANRIRSYFKDNNVCILDSLIYIVSFISKDGNITQQGNIANMKIGYASLDKISKSNSDKYEYIYSVLLAVNKLLCDASIECEIANDIEAQIWKKYILNCAFNVEMTAYNLPIGPLREDKNKALQYEKLLKEAINVAIAKGIAINNDVEKGFIDDFYNKYQSDATSSLLRDYRNNNENNELDTFCGYILREGKKYNVDMNTMEYMYSLIKDKTYYKDKNVLERFLEYVKIDTASSEESNTCPSTFKQKKLGRLLYEELIRIGINDAYFDEEHCYVYGSIPSNIDSLSQPPVVALIAHMDTSPETSAENVKPRLVHNYDGKDIILNQEKNIVMKTADYKELLDYIGQTLVVTDGTTLLGADDKAGVAQIMTAMSIIINNPSIKHGKIVVTFTPDEEIGAGVDHIDLERMGADYAYTVDGGAIGELEYENFNAAYANIVINGVSVHPGDAFGKMKNAMLIAMEYNNCLPSNMRPDNTKGYEGFYHLTDMQGRIEKASLNYIIRNHNRDEFEKMKKEMVSISEMINDKYGEGSCEITIKDSYYNMREIIDPDYMFLIEDAKNAMEKVGIVPKLVPIRGGTDGARLSFMGLPCPNICTGGHNYHGRFEYVVVESMEKIVKMLVELVKRD